MPTKAKKKTVTRSRVTKKNTLKNTSLLSRLKTKQGIIVIAAIALVGAFMVFRSSAATTNFEAEDGTKNNLVTVGSDTTASGGEFTTFAKPTTTTTNNTQRFPGDPNPLVTGKSYWGSSLEGGKDPYERHEVPTGKPLPLRRTFFGWSARTSSMVSGAKADLSKGRLPWVSIKPPSWAEMASGKRDAEIDEMLIALDNIGGPDKPVWFTVHHEPEGGGGSINGGPDDTAGAAGWRGMQKRIRTRINALQAQGKPMDNIAFAPILMGYTFDAGSNRNPEDWWVDGIWDFYGIDVYCYESCSSRGRTLMTTPPLAASVKFVQSKKIPMGIGEWGETNDAATWAQVMRQFWEYGFKNKIDLVGYSAFDSGLNPPAGTTVDTTMPKEVLAVFHDILKNDARVQRIADLNKTSSTSVATTNYGTVTKDISVPENGTYKLWVRMNAPDTTNNAVQAQIDSGAAVKMGDVGVSANAWTWVDWKGGSTSDKTSFVLNAGTRKVTLTGIEAGVKVDRVLLTNETCVPKDTGENCTTITPPPVDATVSMTAPLSGATVKGNVPVKVTSTGDIEMVTFRIAKTGEGSVWQATDETAPYEWTWDTTKFPNGSYDVVTRTRLAGDPGDVYTQRSVTVKVSNSVVVEDPPLPPADSIAPSAPTSLRASLRADWTKMKYVMDLSWTASTDNNEVVAYQISRDGRQIGTSSAAKFTDSTELQAGKTYTYTVTASDAAANKSKATSISLQTQCTLIFCSATVL
jgi:hypothetical protein